MKPNLFQFATSELSQDAFLCWLLAWADVRCRGENPALHDIGVAFLDALFADAKGGPPATPCEIEVKRQVKGTDVVALVGDAHVLVIEDKTTTSNHSEQLVRYREAIGSKYNDRKLHAVYLKTFDQSSYADVRKKGWATFTRGQLLDVLRPGREDVGNAIFQDFLAHLESIEAGVQAYRTTPPAKWGHRTLAWRGFYRTLQSELSEGGWGYVNNPMGGFFGFWWGWQRVPDCEVHLQLEEDHLNVKVQVEDADTGERRRVRNEWVRRILAGMEAHGFVRPKRLGNGRYMTVAVLDGDYRQVGVDGLLDLEATAELLRDVREKIAGIVEAVSD